MNTVHLFIRVPTPNLTVNEDGLGTFIGYPLITAVPGQKQGEMEFNIKNPTLIDEFKTVITRGCMVMVRGRLWVQETPDLQVTDENGTTFIPSRPYISVLVDELIACDGQFNVKALRSK